MAAAKWSDVEANPKYQALSDAGKAELKVRYWNNVVGADPRLKSLSDEGVAQLHKRFFGVLPGEVTQTEPQDNVDRTDNGLGGDLAGAWTVGANSLVAGAGWALKAAGADQAGQAVMNVGEKGMKAGRDMMSKEGIEAGKKKFLTTNWDESVLTHPRALAMAAVESLPGMVIPMGATAVVARTAAAQAAKKAAAIAAKRGASAAVTDRFAAKAAAAAMKKAVIPASIVGEVAVSASGVGQQTYSEVMGMKPEDLDKSQTYRDTVNHYIDNGLSEEEARGMAQEAVAMSASQIAAAISAPASAFAGYAGGKWMGHVLGEAPAGVGKEAARGAATEIVQEVPQSAAEQFGQNAGVKMRADETRSLGKDVAEAAAMGGLVTGPMGGAMGALHGLGGKGNEKPAPSSQPAGDQPNNPAADIPSDALRQHAADLGDSEWDAQSRDEINAELVRRGEQPVESITPPQDAAPEAGQQEPPASAEPAAPATNEVPGHVGYDLDQMNTQQPVAPAPGLGGIADRAQAQTAAQPVEPPSANVDPKTGEVIDELPALNDTQLVKEVRALMANGEPPLAKEIAEKFGIDRDRAGRVLNAAWAVQRQSQVAAPATADVTPQAPPAVANLGQQPAMAVPAPAEFPTMHLAQQALATGGQAETHRVVPKGARFVIEPKPAAASEQSAAPPPEAAQSQPEAPVAQEDTVAAAVSALAAHRAVPAAKGQGKAWAEQEKALQENIKTARKAANAAPAKPVAAPESSDLNAEKFADLYREEHAKQYPDRPLSADFLKERGDHLRKAIENKDTEALRSLNIGDREANPVLRRIFESATGVKLPAGRGASHKAVDQWAGVSEEERAKRDAGKKAASEEKAAQGALGAARRQAAAITVNSPEGKSEAGDKYVDRLISEGYDYLHKRKKGASYTTYLANRATEMALPMTHKALAEYARLAAAENAARQKPEAVAVPEPAAEAPVTTEEHRAGDRRHEAGQIPAMERRGHDRRIMRSGDQVINDDIHDRLAVKGLSDEAIAHAQDAISEVLKDAVTGWGEARSGTLKDKAFIEAERAAIEGDGPVFFVSMDIQNLGGLNAFHNNVEDEANADYRGITDIILAGLEPLGKGSLFMRTGGDEIGAFIQGVDKAAIDAAMQGIRGKIKEYATQRGFSDIPHKSDKSKQNGVSVHYGLAEVRIGAAAKQVYAEANAQLKAAVEGSKNVVRGRQEEGRSSGNAGSQGDADRNPEDAAGKGNSESVRGVEGGSPPGNEVAGAKPATEGKDQGAKPVVTERTTKPEQPGSKIEDFGETLHGARKHYAQAYKDQIAASESIDMAVEPLSKSWPEPDYQKLLDDGVDPWIVAFVRVNRDAIPTKPKKAWKLKGWSEGASALRDSAHKALRGEHTADQIKEVMAKDRFNRSNQKINGIIDLYLAVGHEKSLKGIDFSLSHYSLHGGVKYSPPKAIWTVSRESKSTAFGNWPTELAIGDTREEAIAAFKAKYATMDAPVAKKAEVKFTIYSRTTDDPRKFYIGKKVGKTYVDLKSFATSKEARDFLESGHDELVRLLANNKEIPPERRETNDPRVGVDHRANLSSLNAVVQRLVDRSYATANGFSDALITHAGGSKLPGFIDVPLQSVPLSRGSDDVDASLNKLPAYRLSVFAKFLGNLNNTDTISVNGFYGLDIPGKRLVQSAMLSVGHNPQVRRSVIKLIPVDVMNNLAGTKFSADGLFSDKSMLGDGLAIDGEVPVGRADPAVLAFVRAVASVTAEVAFTDNISRVSLKNDPAVQAGKFDSVLGEFSGFSQDVTPQDFMDAFSFSGVQFGNYVEQSKRQQDLNNAYDALMDLAGVIGVPPKALSLNGELGLAFGARGKGGKGSAAAHYESGTVVINLTKGDGAGSLAHEWWHSVDNYFSRMRQGSGRHYMTDARDVSLAARGSNFVAAPGVRKEVVQAFGDIMRGINLTSVKERSKNLDARRTKAYWSTDIEMSARAFESYVIAKLQDQGASNDYLANIVSEAAWSLEEGYPYPTAGEIADIRAGFDTFFGVVQTKETDKGVAMFSIGQGGKVGMPANTIRNMVDRMKAGAAGIVVRQSAKDLPRAVLDAADKQGIPHDKIRGVHFAGVSYLVADNLTAKEVQAVVFHEAYVHGGLRSRYEGRVEARMIDLANNLQGGGKPHVRVMRLAKQQGISLLAYERGLANDGAKTERQKLAGLTEELMAHIGETTGSLRAYLEEVVGMIRKFLRDVGLSDLSEMGITDIRAELRMAREAYLNQVSNASGEPAFSRRGWSQDFPDAILGMDSATAQAHPDYAAAKAGDDAAALRLARDLVTPEYVESIKAVLGDKKPTIVPVLAVESMGKNRIPVMVANVLGERLGLPVTEDIIQSKKVGRSAGDGFHRLATKVTFSGPVKPGDYLILDDTLTQGGTLAELKTHIEDAGGHVVLASALTGKQYSRKLALSSDTLGQLRERFGSIENWWRDTFGHDFSGLTESEGRFLLKLKGSPRPDAVRDRILAARDEGLRGLGARDDSHGPDQQPVDDVSFSLRGESGKAQTSTVTNLRAWLRNQLAIRTQSSRTFNLLWHRGVGTQYHKGTIDKHYKLVYDIGQEYLNGVARNAADSMEAAPTLLGRMDGFKDWWRDAKSSVTSSQDKKDLAAIAGPIFDGTLKDKKQYTDQELKKQFGLNDKQVGLYREFRNAVEVSLHSLAKAEIFDRLKASKSLPKDVLDTLRDMDVDMDTFTKHIRSEMAKHLKAHAGDADVKKAVASGLASTKEINERINNLLSEGYAPLMRFGEYTVTVRDKAGKIEHFSMHESQADANAAKAALEKAVPKSYTVESGVMAEGENEIFKGISPETIALFGEAAGITKDEAYQEYLKKAIANRSALKRLIHRKEVPGFDKDVQRVLASFVTSNARRAAKLTHLDQLDEAIEAIPQKKGDVKTEAIKFRKYMLDTGNEAQKFRSLLFTYYITGSIASAAVNLTQPITMTFPYLSQWGSARAAKELARATKDGVASFGGTVPADLESAYNRAKRDGVVDPQNIFNMMAMAEGTLTAEGAASRSLKALNHSLAIAFSSAEALNRKSAFIAAFRIGRDLNKAQMEKAGVSSAYEFAVKAVAETQGIYNRGNRPNIGRGAVGATVMCVDDDTEALTQRGWLGPDDLKPGDMMASFDMKTEKLKWMPLGSVHTADFDGEMVHATSRSLDMLMTPDHRVVNYKRGRVVGGNRGDHQWTLGITEAQDIPASSRVQIPTAAEFDHAPQSDIRDEIAPVLGWVVTEGCFYPAGYICIYQNEGKDAEQIRADLKAAGFTWKETTWNHKGGNAPHKRFFIKASQCAEIRDLLPRKHLTPELLMRMSKSQIAAMVERMIDGDGSVTALGQRCLIQNQGDTLEAFQMALTILGKSYSVGRHGPGCMAVLIREPKKNSVGRYSVQRSERVPYKGRVWCPIIPETCTWVARRNGKPFITHNTFKQFSISYVELLRRLWKEDKGSFLIAIGILQMLAGVMGLPFADDIEDVVGSAMSRIGFGENPESKLRDVAQETFGDQWAEFMLYGSSAVLPIDVHGRLGMGNLLPATGVANKFNSPAQQTREMLEIAGVAGGLAQSVTSGQAVPTFARNAAKGAEMIATGEYRNTRDYKIMDATVGEGVAKMLGFHPSSVARETRVLGAEIERVNAQRVMEAKFVDRRAQAIVDGDGKALKQVLADTEAWNERNPKQRIVITGAQITKRVREMKKSREERFLKRVPKEMRGDMRERIAQ